MSTLLVLGSKPDPVLPPGLSYDHIACANASGFSAAKYGLSTPTYTVMSAILTATASGSQSLQALAGLATDTLYFLPRPVQGRSPLKKALQHLKIIRMKPFYLKWKLRSLSYRYNRFITMDYAYYHTLVKELCGYDPKVLEQLERKQPSTGVAALALGMAQQKYQRYILSGFSFELTHGYADNPEIDERGTVTSKHANTDVVVINYLSKKYGNIYTTERVVNERAGVPLFEEGAGRVQEPVVRQSCGAANDEL